MFLAKIQIMCLQTLVGYQKNNGKKIKIVQMYLGYRKSVNQRIQEVLIICCVGDFLIHGYP